MDPELRDKGKLKSKSNWAQIKPIQPLDAWWTSGSVHMQSIGTVISLCMVQGSSRRNLHDQTALTWLDIASDGWQHAFPYLVVVDHLFTRSDVCASLWGLIEWLGEFSTEESVLKPRLHYLMDENQSSKWSNG